MCTVHARMAVDAYQSRSRRTSGAARQWLWSRGAGLRGKEVQRGDEPAGALVVVAGAFACVAMDKGALWP